MTDMDIRVWARENGHAVPARGPVSASVRDAFEAANAGDVAGDAGDPVELEPIPDVAGERPPTVVRTRPAPEARPPATGGPAGWLDRARRRTPTTGAGGRPRKRVSIEGLVGSVWGMAAMAIARNPAMLPVARVLDLQAPVAGAIVEDVARGTVVDRVLQPLARMGEKGQQIGALIGPPLIVAAITAQPALFPTLAPVLKATLMTWVQISAPAMKKAQERAEKFAAEHGGLDIDAMIDMLFAPPPGFVDSNDTPGGMG